MQNKIALIALLIILVLVNWKIAGKEAHLKNGRVVYLELAPVDPRSLMQGDYMALRFRMAGEVYSAVPKKTEGRWRRDVDSGDGYAVAQLDKRNIAVFKRIHKDESLAADEVMLRYRVRNGAVKFATNAFFFQEGHANVYEPARYGEFRVDENGELLLVAMYDKDLNKLTPVGKNNAPG